MNRVTEEYWRDLKEEAVKNVKQTFKTGDDIEISLIQRRCRLGYNAAYMAFEALKQEGIVNEKGLGVLGITRYAGE